MKKALFSLIVLVALPFCAAAQENNTFGGWIFTEVNHSFRTAPLYITAYFEHDNYQFQRLECNYARLSFGVKPFKWMKLGLNYVPIQEPGIWKHCIEAEIMGTLKSGNFKVSIRERWRHVFTTGKNELRSRLKVSYNFPNSKFSMYLAPEVFTWGDKWQKTRHYLAAAYDITPFMQLEWYYLYYAFATPPAEHVIGIGLNFDL